MTTSVTDRSRGRTYLLMGIVLSILAIGAVMFQYQFGQLMVPWYAPAVTTFAALLLILSLAQRRSVTRVVALLLIASLAGFQWFFLVSLARLPVYSGPARAGQEVPAFRTTLASGKMFSEKDLQDGKASVMVFFRGRW